MTHSIMVKKKAKLELAKICIGSIDRYQLYTRYWKLTTQLYFYFLTLIKIILNVKDSSDVQTITANDERIKDFKAPSIFFLSAFVNDLMIIYQPSVPILIDSAVIQS